MMDDSTKSCKILYGGNSTLCRMRASQLVRLFLHTYGDEVLVFLPVLRFGLIPGIFPALFSVR